MTKRQDIINLHKTGHTVLQISKITGYKRPTIYYHLQAVGLDANVKRAGELTSRKVDQIIADFSERGLSKAEIARRRRCTYDQVRYAIAKYL